jgi:hypothetical protein
MQHKCQTTGHRKEFCSNQDSKWSFLSLSLDFQAAKETFDGTMPAFTSLTCPPLLLNKKTKIKDSVILSNQTLVAKE